VGHVDLQGINSVVQRERREGGQGRVVGIVVSLFPFPGSSSHLGKGGGKGGQGRRGRAFAAAATKVGGERREGEEEEQDAGQKEAKGSGGVVEEGGLAMGGRSGGQGTEHSIADQE